MAKTVRRSKSEEEWIAFEYVESYGILSYPSADLSTLVHGDREDNVSQILRAFDLYVLSSITDSHYLYPCGLHRNYDYGPCIGVSRLERWERAHLLGLNPPPEVCIIVPLASSFNP